MKPTAFMSEHTAEYALVPDLIAQLADGFARVIPMWFWSTREGARVGHESMDGERVRVLAAYARRPKVVHPDQHEVVVKVNAQLFVGAGEGSQLGIPVLTGVPLVGSLVGFRVGAPCSWFHLAPTSVGDSDYQFVVSLSERAPMPVSHPSISGPLTREQIIQLVESQSRELQWAEAAEGMRLIRRAGKHDVRWFFGGGYRPFFLVMLAQEEDAPTKRCRISARNRAERSASSLGR